MRGEDRRQRRGEGPRKGRLNVLTEGHLLMVGALRENFGFGCVGGLVLSGPIARGEELG